MEVATQLRPLETALNNLVHRFKSFYKNGDQNAPDGAYDARVKIDDARAQRVEATLASQDKKLDELVAAKNISDGAEQGVERRRVNIRASWTMVAVITGMVVGIITLLLALYVFARSGHSLSELIPTQKQVDSAQPRVYAKFDSPPQSVHLRSE